MRLDTSDLFREAITLYEEFGFRQCVPFHRYPAEAAPYIIFMERPLNDPKALHRTVG